MRRWGRCAPMLLLAAALLAGGGACMAPGGTTAYGFSDEIAATQVAVNADPRGALRWDKQEYQTTAGDVTFVVRNTSQAAHNFGVQGNGVNAVSKNFKGGEAVRLTIKDLKPGEYLIVCTVPGHRESGMTAKLTVR